MTTDTATPPTVTTYAPSRAQQAGVAHAKAAVHSPMDEAAANFESMFMSQMMQFVWSGAGATGADETFGGGHGEEMWRGMLVNEYGKIASQTGSLGIADQVKSEMIRIQAAQQNQAAQEAAAAMPAPVTRDLKPSDYRTEETAS